MKLLLNVVLSGLVGTVAIGQEPATLVDRFDKIGCSDFRGRLDQFLKELSENPSSKGYVALSSEGDRFRALFPRWRMINDQIAWRNFDPKCVFFVRRSGLADYGTEFWRLQPGGELPFKYESEWSFDLARHAKPFILLYGGFNESECPEPRDVDFAAKFLRANPESRINVVIQCGSRRCDRDLRRQFISDIKKTSGISPGRFKFFSVPIKSMYYSYEFWILN